MLFVCTLAETTTTQCLWCTGFGGIFSVCPVFPRNLVFSYTCVQGFCAYFQGFWRISKDFVYLPGFCMYFHTKAIQSLSTSHKTRQSPIFLNLSMSNESPSKFQRSPFKIHENPFWISQIPIPVVEKWCNVGGCCKGGVGQQNRRGCSFCLYQQVESPDFNVITTVAGCCFRLYQQQGTNNNCSPFNTYVCFLFVHEVETKTGAPSCCLNPPNNNSNHNNSNNDNNTVPKV